MICHKNSSARYRRDYIVSGGMSTRPLPGCRAYAYQGARLGTAARGQGEQFGEQFAGERDDLAADPVLAKPSTGRLRSPVSLAQRIRSSHRRARVTQV